MIVNVTSRAKFAFPEAPCALALPVFEDTFPVASPLLDEADARTLGRWHEKGLVRGKAEEVHFLPSAGDGYEGVLLLGLGKRDACSTETLRRAAGQGCATLSAHRLEQVVFDAASLPELAHGVVEGLLLGQYRFDSYKEHKPGDVAAPQVESITVVLESEAPAVMRRCEQARLACESANWARDLANTPPNDMTPSRLAGSILEMAEDAGCTGEVFHRDQLEALGMRAFLGVARGSVEPPTLTVLRYTQESATQTVALVGKGITFDTGGISLKPGQGMHEMKFDMCGAAAVAGAFRAIAALRPALNVVCVIPACENAPGGHAQRPGDIVRAYNGKTIEVHNTDAEGRLLKRFLPLGLTSFLAQISLVISMAAVQNMCTKYGALDAIFGQPQYAQIPLAILGIVMKFFQIAISIAVGMAAGCIPIVGYNIGAGRADRAKAVFTRLLIAEAAAGFLALLIVELFQNALVGIFGAANESAYYTEFAVKCFRIYLCMMPLATVNKGTFIFLQSIGKAVESTVISLTREVILGVALPILLPVFYGLDGLLYSFPAADILTFAVAAFIIRRTCLALTPPAGACADAHALPANKILSLESTSAGV